MKLKPMLLAVSLGWWISPAGAVPIVTFGGSGLATGIQDLVVDGTAYDVSFVPGSYASVFASSTPTFLANGPGAEDAAAAMVSVISAQSGLVRTTTVATGDGLEVPYGTFQFSQSGVLHTDYLAAQLGTNAGITAWRTFADFVDSTSDDLSPFGVQFAVFQPVPDAGETLSLLALSLLALACARLAIGPGGRMGSIPV